MVPVKRRLGEGALQEEGVDGLRRSCRLLRSLAGEDALELLREFAPWVLRAAPEEGLKLFTLGEASTVPIAPFVLELLQGLAEPQRSEFRARYVQYLVVMHRVDTPAVNTEYVLDRLAQLQALAQQRGVSLAVEKLEDTPAACRDLRTEILSFWRPTRGTTPRRCSRRLPKNRSFSSASWCWRACVAIAMRCGWC